MQKCQCNFKITDKAFKLAFYFEPTNNKESIKIHVGVPSTERFFFQCEVFKVTHSIRLTMLSTKQFCSKASSKVKILSVT
jgi:hypothetical protein